MQVTAVSDKTNTTGAARLGAFTEGISQVALYDTPGVVHTRCGLFQTLQSALKTPVEANFGQSLYFASAVAPPPSRAHVGHRTGLVVPEAVTTCAGRYMGLAMHEVCAQPGGQPASVIC